MIKNKSKMQQSMLKHAAKQYEDSLTEEQKKERRYKKLEEIFTQLGNKENRYLFYCPDIPFACTLVKTIYETAYILHKANYNITIVHDIKGYKPAWLIEDWKDELKVSFLSEKKNNKYTKPSFTFLPTDTIIIPEGFWTVMQGFAETKSLHKIVYAFGYGGLATIEPGLSWRDLGFTDVICISERIKTDYQKLFPNLTYHILPYYIDTELFEPNTVDKIYPAIALNCRSREDAQTIINVFYNRYPFLDMFQFKVLKKMDTESYADVLKHCCIHVFVDEKAGHPAPPLEALACNIPTIAVYGRGMEHLVNCKDIMWLDNNDNFLIAETIADFCFNWLQNKTTSIEDKTLLNNYTKETITNKAIEVFELFQQDKIKRFAAIKNAVDLGRLSDEQLNVTESITEEQVKNEEPQTTTQMQVV